MEDKEIITSAITKLKPCPFCGGQTVEKNPSWNMAHAECVVCGEQWGFCGKNFDGRLDSWNTRAPETKLDRFEADIKQLHDVFGHTHESNGIDDICAACNLDLRNSIHIRVPKQ